MVVKFPPTQGGVSARAALLAETLAGLGHEVFVVTNSRGTEREFRITVPVDYDDRILYTGVSDGRVTVRQVSELDASLRHIPQTGAEVTMLAAIAAETTRENSCDVLFSNYLEPYGVAAHLASLWTGVPHVVKTAGSDRIRLLNHPDLRAAYREVYLAAAAVIEEPGPLIGLGVEERRLVGRIPSIVPRTLFNTAVEPFRLGRSWTEAGEPHPTVGIYGKVSAAKGFHHLTRALGRLAQDGVEFDYSALAGGRELESFETVVAEAGIESRSVISPFLPYPLVGRYLKACDVVACLEHDFRIAEHVPVKAREVLGSGTRLVVSRELVRKDSLLQELFQQGDDQLRVVDDPSDQASVVDALMDCMSMKRPAGAEMNSRQATSDERQWAGEYARAFDRASRVTSRKPSAGSSVSELATAMPVARALLGARYHRAEADFLTQFDGRSRPLPVQAMAFGDYLVKYGRQWCADVPEWAWRLNQAATWLATDLEGALGVPYFDRDHAQVADPQNDRTLGDLSVLRTSQVRLLRIPACGPGDVRQLLVDADTGVRDTILSAVAGLSGLDRTTRQRDETAEGPAPSLLLMFHRQPNLHTGVYRVGAVTAELVRLADGTRTVRDLCAGFRSGAELGAIARQMVSKRILTWVDGQDRNPGKQLYGGLPLFFDE